MKNISLCLDTLSLILHFSPYYRLQPRRHLRPGHNMILSSQDGLQGRATRKLQEDSRSSEPSDSNLTNEICTHTYSSEGKSAVKSSGGEKARGLQSVAVAPLCLPLQHLCLSAVLELFHSVSSAASVNLNIKDLQQD